MEVMMIFDLPLNEETDEDYKVEDIKSIKYSFDKDLKHLFIEFKDGEETFTNGCGFINETDFYMV